MRPNYTTEQIKEMFACYLIRGITLPSKPILEKRLEWYAEVITRPYEEILEFEIQNAVERMCK